MSWIQKLYETYENCQAMIGAENDDNEVPLLPICHSTQKAQIEIVIDENGSFKRAKVIPKDEARTIIPCTEKSGGRTSGEAPHPLSDKLQYIAKDYWKWGGKKDSYFESYLAQLEEWCNSEFSDPKILAINRYVKRGNIISDLVDNQILFAEKNNLLLKKWDKSRGEKTPEIFEIVTGSQEEAFIRWIVEIPGILEPKVWRDKLLWDKWIHFYSTKKSEKSFCYVTGEEDSPADQHPAKLRNDGDKAKLISANDSSGFTYRGRFTTPQQVAVVGFETTQKAHSALRWLISRQGYRKDDLAIVAWATSGTTIPKPTDDLISLLGLDNLPMDSLSQIDTAQDLAIKLRNRIAGYGQELGDTTKIIVMALDSATPGRMAITFYCELSGADFFRKLNNWHESCAWIHTYRSIDIKQERGGRMKKTYIPFIGAPAPKDIASAAYGEKADGKLLKSTIMRILPCIIEGQQIPRDIVETTVRRASNRIAMENWEWNKTLTIACALFRKYNQKEIYEMTLDPNRKTRDYLYGRLLALADSLEEWALNTSGERRETNAARLMQRFSEHPYSTWRTIEIALTPYKARLGGKSKKRQQMIDEVISSFNPDDFVSDKRLSGEFLLGYHCQRNHLHKSVEASNKEEENN